jgi:hypothetical protein
MDNQHKKIKGYRDLSQQEIDAMNKIKMHGEQLGLLMAELVLIPNIDQRWLAMAEEELQKGIMFAVRAVAQPTTF